MVEESSANLDWGDRDLDYFFGRAVLALLGFVSLGLLLIGVMFALSAAGGAGYAMRQSFGVAVPASLLAAIPGMIVALIGLVLLAMVDHFSATLDTATATKKMLQVAEDQLRVSRQVLRVGALTVPGYADMSADERGRLLGNGKSDRKGFLGLFAKSNDDPTDTANWITENPAPENGGNLNGQQRTNEGGRRQLERIEPSFLGVDATDDQVPVRNDYGKPQT